MFATSLKLYFSSTIAGDYHQLEHPEDVSTYSVREYFAYLNGEGADSDAILEFASRVHVASSLALPPKEDLVINTKGRTMICSRLSLMRRYHFINDLLTEFPEVGEIDLPFSDREVKGAVYLKGSLSDCLACMKYLNPKKADEYFQLEELGNVSDEALLGLVNDLTDDDVDDMMEARDYTVSIDEGYVPLPRGGRDRPALARILEVFGDVERQMRFFSAYPAYLCAMIDDEDVYTELLLRTDFSQSNERYGTTSRIANRVYIALGVVQTKQDAAHLFAMLGIHRKELGNCDKKVTAPYRVAISLDRAIEGVMGFSHTRRNPMTLFGWSLGQLKSVLENDSGSE